MISTVVITDCQDANAAMRICVRLQVYLQDAVVPRFVPVTSELEAAGNLVDALDAMDGQRGLILCSVNTKYGQKTQWKNGAPFGRVRFDKVEIIAPVEGYVFSLLQKIWGKKLCVEVYDINTSLPHLMVEKEKYEHVAAAQFRSFEYLPRLAAAMVWGTRGIPFEPFRQVPTLDPAVWMIDCFGNIKTTVLAEEVNFRRPVLLTCAGLVRRKMYCFDSLAKVGDRHTALVCGNSGLWVKGKNQRFVEIVVGGGSAAKRFGISVGDQIRLETG